MSRSTSSPYCAYCFGSHPPVKQHANGRWYHPECAGKDTPSDLPREIGGHGGDVALRLSKTHS